MPKESNCKEEDEDRHDDRTTHNDQNQRIRKIDDHKTPSSPSTTTTTDSNLSPEQKAQRERRMTTLQASISKLESQIADTEAQITETRSRLKSPNVSDTVKTHIRFLHSYNEIKDVGQGLMGLIAEARGVRYVDVQREFGIEAGD